jgi:histidinol dehydrogenase
VLRRLDLRGQGLDLRGRLPRPAAGGAAPLEAVQRIISDVRERGDDAVRELTERFDGCRLDDPHVDLDECRAALERIDPALRRALEVAAANIRAYHEAQIPAEAAEHGGDGLTVRELRRPVDRAGCYAPGGRASYPSTVLMTVIPAKVAGVPEVVLAVPPRRDGTLPDEVLAAAAVAGADEVVRIGGAQAIAALAHGTDLVRPVDVIVGPGNVYVALAKREVAGVVGIPSAFAGPSEVVVVADGSAPVDFAAIDVVLQAEHGPDGLAWLVTWDEAVADEVSQAVAELVASSPRRADIEATLHEGGYAVVCDSPEQAMAVANEVAPEHLELITENPEALLPLVRHAGAVFCGPWAPASMGDYVAGPNHVLPTFGSARFSEALRVDDFVKHVHVVTLDRGGFDRLAEHVAALADAEGLHAHAQSVRLRQRS